VRAESALAAFAERYRLLVFQQALWIGGTDQQDQGQEIDLLK
jgi:hypothetical protein